MQKRNKVQPTKQFYRRLIGIALVIIISTILLEEFKARSFDSSFSVLTLLTGDSRSEGSVVKPDITEELLTPNRYSRPQIALSSVNGVVIHYVGNAGSTAQANRDYFEGLKDTGETSASSHFVVDTDGTIIQCIPLDEISYASNDRNSDTISIEVCHPDDSGQFTDASYNSLIKLVSWLVDTYQLDKNDIIRHYDVTGKICPKYYVEHEDAWEQLKDDIWEYAN